VTADLLAETAPELAELHAAIPYASVALVNLGYATADLPPLPDSYGYVTPLVEGRRALAVTWSSQKWPNRAPAGQLLLRVYLGRYGEPDVTALDDETLFAWARAEVAEVCGIGVREMFGRVVRWPRAMPQYTLGHPERLRQIELALAEVPGLFLAGAAYRGVGIPDCIREGDKAGRAAVGGVKSEK
jgi:protoporphyrinogen/coproporphyrinogen III oxidase